MKQTVIAIAVAASLCAFGEDAPAPAAPAAAASANAATARDTTDVIDLDEADDSAEARANAPVVTATSNEKGVTLVDIACDHSGI